MTDAVTDMHTHQARAKFRFHVDTHSNSLLSVARVRYWPLPGTLKPFCSRLPISLRHTYVYVCVYVTCLSWCSFEVYTYMLLVLF